jgi:hypothetical protein
MGNRRLELSSEKFSLSADPKMNYVNLVLNDMKIFNSWYSAGNNVFQTARALRSLVLDLPPEGQEFMKEEKDDLVEWEHTKFIYSYALLGEAYQKVMTWVWPNLLQEYFNAKPRNPQPSTLGEQ